MPMGGAFIPQAVWCFVCARTGEDPPPVAVTESTLLSGSASGMPASRGPWSHPLPLGHS